MISLLTIIVVAGVDTASAHSGVNRYATPFSINMLSRSLHMMPLSESSQTSPHSLLHRVNNSETDVADLAEYSSEVPREFLLPLSYSTDLRVIGGGGAIHVKTGGNHTQPSYDDAITEIAHENDNLKDVGPQERSIVTQESSVGDGAFHPIHLDSHSGVDPSAVKKAAKYAKKLRNRNRLNLKRKVLHAAFGLFFATVNQLIPRNKFVPCMIVLTSSCLFMELMRFRKGFGWMNDTLHFILGSALRKQEMEGKFTGSFYYFLGVTLTTYLFPKNAATLGICQLALADPSASFFGRQTRHIYWSRIENGLGGIGRNKGILGFLGGALFCVPFNYRMLSLAKWGASGIPGGSASLLTASVALGVAGAFADLLVPTPALTMPKKVLGVPVPPFHVDDNFVVPLFSALACTKIFDLLGWPRSLELAKYLFF